MTVRIVMPGAFFGLVGTVERTSASGGYWVRFAPGDWPAGVADWLSGHWSDSRLILCRDGKARRIPVESGFQPVVDGLSDGVDGGGPACSRFPLSGEKIEGRVMLLRGAGNAIVPQVAAAFIRAYLEASVNQLPLKRSA